MIILPFLFGVLVPVFSIPWLVRRLIKTKTPRRVYFIYSIACSILVIVANIIWEFFLFNKVYYEWDRMFIPFTFYHHEGPAFVYAKGLIPRGFTSEGSWLAPGWGLQDLTNIWFGLIIIIVFISYGVTFLLSFRKKGSGSLHRFLLVSSLALITVSFFVSLLPTEVKTILVNPLILLLVNLGNHVRPFN